MKFGKDLEANIVKKWAAHYIDYEAMKRLLSTGQSTEVKRAFHELHTGQLQKVSAFYLSEIERVEQAVSHRALSRSLSVSFRHVYSSCQSSRQPSDAKIGPQVQMRNAQLKAMSAVDEVQTSGQHYKIFRDLTDLRSFVRAAVLAVCLSCRPYWSQLMKKLLLGAGMDQCRGVSQDCQEVR